jgi:hypothetical protein
MDPHTIYKGDLVVAELSPVVSFVLNNRADEKALTILGESLALLERRMMVL